MALKITVEVEFPSTVAASGYNTCQEVIYAESPISYTELERIIRRIWSHHQIHAKSVLGVEIVEKPETNKKVAGQSKVN